MRALAAVTSIVDQDDMNLGSISQQRSRRLATGAERGGDTSGEATARCGCQDVWHVDSPNHGFGIFQPDQELFFVETRSWRLRIWYVGKGRIEAGLFISNAAFNGVGRRSNERSI